MVSTKQSHKALLPALALGSGLVIASAALLLVFFPALVPRPSAVLVTIGVVGLAQVTLAAAVLAFSPRATAEVPPPPTEASPVVTAAAPPPRDNTSQPAGTVLMLLALLQEKGRFIDFVMEDITAYSDEQVSAAARVVHQGCREVVREAFDPQPISHSPHDQPIELPVGYSSRAFRVIGNLDGHRPPFSGTLLHGGWQARRIKLPESTGTVQEGEPAIIVPAQVEL